MDISSKGKVLFPSLEVGKDVVIKGNLVVEGEIKGLPEPPVVPPPEPPVKNGIFLLGEDNTEGSWRIRVFQGALYFECYSEEDGWTARQGMS